MPDVLERLQTALADRYAIQSEIGRGGMATVFLAQDLRHDRRVAVKVLHPELAATLGADRFLREIQIAARLEHPHILTLIDSGEADGLPYFVMSFVEGESLGARLQREAQLPLDEALRIAREVADGLDYAHEQGVVHRDIKPGNILLSRGHALIADFGIAKAVDAASAGDRTATATGLTVGTPRYMSPEQAAGTVEVDGRSDVYALGCVMWEMLAGEPPFDGPTPHVILARKAIEEPPQVRVARKTVPPALENVLLKAMATSPADRFQTAGDLARALEAPETVGRVRRRGRLGQRLVTVALAVLLIGAGVWLARVFSGATDSSGGSAVALDPSRMVILPFSEPGGMASEGLSGEGVAYLLSVKLGGVGSYRSVPPANVLTAFERECVGIADEACGSTVARGLGAGLVITGETLKVGNQLHLAARVHDLRSRGTTEPVVVEGDPARAHLLVNDLAERLLAGIAGADAERLFRAAPPTTDSLEAVKAYLEGVRLIREKLYPDATEALQRAVAIDSSFALGWYRLSLAADWSGNFDLSTRAASRASELSQSLPLRERRLLEAFSLFKAGDGERAEALYREVLSDYPTDNEARFKLGWLLQFRNWTRGRPQEEALPYLRSVVRDDPDYSVTWEHYVNGLGWSGLWAELDSVLSLPGHEDRMWRIVLAAVGGDSASVESIRAELRGTLPEYTARGREAWAGMHLFEVCGFNGLARPLLLEQQLPRFFVRKGYPSLVSGRFSQGVAEYRELEPMGIEPGIHPFLGRAWLHTLPFLPITGERYAVAMGELREWLSADVQNTEDPTSSYWRGTYLQGLFLAAMGQPEEALERARELEAAAGSDSRRLPERLALGIRAQLYWNRGELERALEALESMPELKEEDWGMHRPVDGGWRELYLRAEILRQLGRLNEAETWFQHSVGYRFPAESFLKRGEIAEARRDTEQAIEWYGKFVLLWEDADDWLQPRVDGVRQRIARLESE